MTSRLFPGYSPEYTWMQKSEPYNEGWVWEGRLFCFSVDSTAIPLQEGK
jgi:hypothetical protein